jgi:pimeloyl-ACP methyl ester carboxylesterase/acyl-CoA thioesterase FadM
VAPHEVDLTVYPDECDAYGHLNQASALALFERARWEVIARGPGMDLFTRHNVWPAARKATIEYHAQAYPGDVLRFAQTMVHLGRTSFTLRQTARRLGDDTLVSSLEIVFVMVNPQGAPVPVPEPISQAFVDRILPGNLRRIAVNGVNLAVDIRGRGPAILFIHGYPLDHAMWEPQLGALDGWMRIAPDLRGMGQSDAPDLGYSMATYADDLLALLTTLGVDKAVVCGLSMGGYVAFEMLRRAPERIRALVVIDSRAEADTAEGRRARDAEAAKAREGGPDAIADAMMPKLFDNRATAVDQAIQDQVRRVIVATPYAGLLGAIGALRDRPDSFALLRSLKELPALVVVGEEDKLTPPERAQAMVDVLPQGELVVVPGAGHLSSLERPDVVTSALRGFLDRLAR